MFSYYKNARICYAYLADFEGSCDSLMEGYRNFAMSRWFTRGWTLQELLAPAIVEFYNSDWDEIGTKLSLQEQLTEITGIDEGILRGADPLRRNVAVRMSWAARRVTSRLEDRAYSLMGLFGVHMPLLYGEGSRAFIRLQEEIMRVQEDYTLFTWCPDVMSIPHDAQISKGLLADSPSDFIDNRDHYTLQTLTKGHGSAWSFRDLSIDSSSVFNPLREQEPPYLTSRGLRISLPIIERNSGEIYACITLVHTTGTEVAMLCVALHRLSPKFERYIRRAGTDLTLLPKASAKSFKYRPIYVLQPPPDSRQRNSLQRVMILNNTPTQPSLVLIHFDLGESPPLKCYLSSWISMDQVLQARFISTPNNAKIEPTVNSLPLSNGKAEGALHRHRVNKIVDHLISLNYNETVSLALGTPSDLCWFSDADSYRIYSTSGYKGVLGFAMDDQSDSAILVQLGLLDERPLCHVKLTTMEMLRDPAKRAQIFEEAQQAPLQRDRQTLFLKENAKGDESPPNVELTVGIRRLASASIGVKRYKLCISQKRVLDEGKPSDEEISDEEGVLIMQSMSTLVGTESHTSND